MVSEVNVIGSLKNSAEKKPISVFWEIFAKGGDLDYHDLDSRSSRDSAVFYAKMSVVSNETVSPKHVPTLFPSYSAQNG